MTRKLQILMGVALLTLIPVLGFSQTTLTSTTLSANITTGSATSFTVASATGFAANRFAFVDREAMQITSVSGTTITAIRGALGTVASPHTSGQTVYVGSANSFTNTPYDPAGRCTSTTFEVLPFINVQTGSLVTCTSSIYDVQRAQLAEIQGTYGLNLDLTTSSDSKPVRINSRNYTQATGSSIGFQVKPAQTVATTGQVIGGEISPRYNSGIAGGGIIGLHVDSYLKGTAVGTITGDVRTLQLEVVTDDAGTRTVTGNVNAIRIRSAFAATTISGVFAPIRIEIPETMTNSKTYDAVLDLTSTGTAWSDTDTASGDTEAGFIRVRVNGNYRRIVLYSDET